MPQKITNIKVTSSVDTLFLTGSKGEYDAADHKLWVEQEGSQESNGGLQQNTTYKITFSELGSPINLKFKGRFAGVGYEFE